MQTLSAHQAAVAQDIVLDGRLALYHETERWLAVADLHFGYELSQRAAGRLLPMWGMHSVESRLLELLEEYQPARLLILGDLVHDRAAAAPAGELIERLQTRCEVILLAGNHDRHLARNLSDGGLLGDGRLPFSPRTLRFRSQGTRANHWTSSSRRDGERRRRDAAKIAGVRPTRKLLDHACVLALGGGDDVEGGRGKPAVAVHAPAHPDVAASGSSKQLSARGCVHLGGAVRAAAGLDRNGHGARWAIARHGIGRGRWPLELIHRPG